MIRGGGGPVVNFYSDSTSSNPAEVYIFTVIFMNMKKLYKKANHLI